MYAQLNATVIGDAINQGDNCFAITPASPFQNGGVWYDNPIDFDNDFTIYYQNNFGNIDLLGADGMALVFTRDVTTVLGYGGGGLGYGNLSPSLVVEFDTFQNFDFADPTNDHITITRNGDPNHNNTGSNLAGPVQASATNPNIEDGNSHEVKIVWDATAKELSVFFEVLSHLLKLSIKF